MSKKKNEKLDPRLDKYRDYTVYDKPAYFPRKKRFTDRSDGRRIRSLSPMTYVATYIMKTRNDACNQFEDVIDITAIEKYLAKKKEQGYNDMTILHVIIAAYIRIVAERPGVNRFLNGNRIYSRDHVELVMAIKKEMTVEGEETMIKPEFDPRDNIYDVYKKFQLVAKSAITESTDFDGTAKTLTRLPRPLLRGAIRFFDFLDYHGWIPKSLLKVSPFHGSIIITSMGSLGIPAIYHHLYNFGNLPVFLSYGSIFSADAILADGTRERHHFVTLKVNTDERICDGFYYASAFKRLKRYLLHPEILDQHPEKIVEDVE